MYTLQYENILDKVSKINLISSLNGFVNKVFEDVESKKLNFSAQMKLLPDLESCMHKGQLDLNKKRSLLKVTNLKQTSSTLYTRKIRSVPFFIYKITAFSEYHSS